MSIFPDNFKFSSEINMFKELVDFLKQKIEDKEAYILFETISNIYVEINEYPFNENITTEQWSDVLNEIAFIITSILENDEYNLRDNLFSETATINDLSDRESLKSFLAENSLEEENINDICNLVEEKFQYTYKKLITKELIQRYCYKKSTICKKLLSFDFDINKYQYYNKFEVPYANIRITSSDIVPDVSLPANLAKLVRGDAEGISFVCDKYDLELLIDSLVLIKSILD